MIAAADSRAPTAAVLDGAQTRDPATVTGACSRCRHRICAEARLAVRARTAGLTAADLDRAPTNERSLVVTWLNRGTLQQKQTAPKRLAKAKRDRRQRGAAHPKPAADLGASPERGRAPLRPRTARVRDRPSASRSHHSVGPHRLRRQVGSS
jgi:hypothetical protein